MLIAGCQRGVVSRGQLCAAGIAEHVIDYMLSAGRLLRLHDGVYAVGHLAPIPLAVETAAVLATGPNSLLSNGHAAALWELRPHPSGPVEITVAHRRHLKTPGVRIHRTRQLLDRDVRVHKQLPVTSPARTLLDEAGTVTTRELERELDEALTVLKIVTVDEIEDVLARAQGRRGAGVLRRLLRNRAHETITREEAERLFLATVREAGLPEPETQVWLEGFSVDFLWRSQRVVFEIDGYTFHTSRSAFDRDRRKDLVLKAAGWDPNRVSRDQVKYERLTVLAHVAGALARAARAA